MIILSYVFLAISAISYGASTLIKNKKWLLAVQIVSSFMYIFSLLCLKAMTAFIVAIFDTLRLVVFYFVELKKGGKKAKLYAGLALFVVCVFSSYFSWNGWYSILPICSSFIILICLVISKDLYIKFSVLISAISVTIYLILNGLFIAAGLEAIAILNALIGLILTFIQIAKNKSKKEVNEKATIN